MSNAEKTSSPSSGIGRIIQHQQQLDQELNFIIVQRKKLEDLTTLFKIKLDNVMVTDTDWNYAYQNTKQ